LRINVPVMTISCELVGSAGFADSFDCTPAGGVWSLGAAGGVLPCVSVGVTGAGGCGGFCANAGAASVTPAIIVVASSEPLKVVFDIIFPF
jgi:hypothetical protein